jgi:hypothetical protein
MLQPDVEGLTLLREGAKTWLIASSQGDSAFGVWRMDGAAPVYSGRFSVVAAHGVDGVTGTDGVAAMGGVVRPYAEGLLVMQDDVDVEGETPSTTRERQNFKLVDWWTGGLAGGEGGAEAGLAERHRHAFGERTALQVQLAGVPARASQLGQLQELLDHRGHHHQGHALAEAGVGP